MPLLELAEKLPAVDAGHHDVEQNEIRRLVLDRAQSALAAFSASLTE